MNNNPHWVDTDWMPEPQQYDCQCGCGESVIWQGIGRKPKFVNETHRKRYQRRMSRKLEQNSVSGD